MFDPDRLFVAEFSQSERDGCRIYVGWGLIALGVAIWTLAWLIGGGNG